MTNEYEEEPEELVDEADMFDLLASPAANGILGASEQRGHRTASARSGVLGRIRPVVRGITVTALGLAILVIGALALTQGLTAALRTSLPTRIAGINGSGDGNVALSVETKIMPAAKPTETAWRAEKPVETAWRTEEVTSSEAVQPPVGQKFAEIRDVAQGADTSNRPHIVPDTNVEKRGYLPPEYQPDWATAGTVITVPVSQGRLLKFDEPVESVFIADPTVADIRVVSQDLVYVYGKRSGRTNLLAVSSRSGGDGQPKLTGSALLRVVWDDAAPNEAKKTLSPDMPANIFIFGTRPAIKGVARNIDQAVDAANVAQTFTPPGQLPINDQTLLGSNQINIRVRFAEVNRKDLKSFGIDWNIGVNAGGFQFGVQKSGSVQTPNLSFNNGFGGTGKIGNVNLDVLIEALQSNGALTVLAEPNLTAVTGETASFLAGGEVPIPVPTAGTSGANQVPLVGIQYKTFGVSLNFTPTIVKENRIGLRVKPEVSAIDNANNFSFQGFNVPGFTVRRADTTVEVASGETFAIGGLFQRDVSRTIDKLPMLGDVPVLGQLFRSERYQRNETELVILITPYLVEPVRDKHLATPLDRVDTGGPDLTAKGAGLTSRDAEKGAGFILK